MFSSELDGIEILFGAQGCVSPSVCSDIAARKSPVTVSAHTFDYTFTKVTCQAAKSTSEDQRNSAFTLDNNNLGSQAAVFFPCLLGFLVVKINS